MRAPSLTVLTSILALTCAAPTSRADPPLPQLSDADLVAYAAKPFDKAKLMFKQVRLGVNRGLVVLADFPCGDVCPDSTTRIIHYDLDPGPACEAAGGATATRAVPFAISVMEKQFCVPRVLAPHA
jgi:hypothetical protein